MEGAQEAWVVDALEEDGLEQDKGTREDEVGARWARMEAGRGGGAPMGNC